MERDRAETAIAVVRGNIVMRPGDARCQPLEPNDLVVYINAKEETMDRAGVRSRDPRTEARGIPEGDLPEGSRW